MADFQENSESSPRSGNKDRNEPTANPGTEPLENSSPEEEPVFELEIEDALDLHTFAPRDILTAVEGYLEAAHDKGFEEVRLIHGKGIGFQRDRVQKYLSTHPLVLEYQDAPAGRGHWGATLARLRPRGSGTSD